MTAPGWYKDTEVSGGLRWWDGERWSEHRAPIVPAVEPRPPTKRRVWVIVGALVLVAVLAAVVAGRSEDDGPSPAGVQSAAACQSVVAAAREYASGSRSQASFLAAVKGQEGNARAASDANSRYLPITQAIVSVEADLIAGRTPTAGLVLLARECGS